MRHRTGPVEGDSLSAIPLTREGILQIRSLNAVGKSHLYLTEVSACLTDPCLAAPVN